MSHSDLQAGAPHTGMLTRALGNMGRLLTGKGAGGLMQLASFALIARGLAKPVDAEAAARLVNGAALNAALWIAASDDPQSVFPKAVEAFRTLLGGLRTARK